MAPLQICVLASKIILSNLSFFLKPKFYYIFPIFNVTRETFIYFSFLSNMNSEQYKFKIILYFIYINYLFGNIRVIKEIYVVIITANI